jgi:hypothetical protein
MRLEQRIGRVDRIGQTRTVHAFHLIAGGTAEVRVLQRLGIRIARAQADVGVPNPLSAQQPSDGSSGLATARMEVESSREHDRLTLARRVAPPASTASFDASLVIERHPLVTFTKRRVIRARLGSQVLTVFLSVLAEESGQPVAYDLLPAQLRFRLHEPWSLQQLESLGGLLRGDRRYNAWLTSSLAIHAAFWNTRLTRERSIANGREGMALAELQPGLFDLRAEHTWIDEEERRSGALREHARFATAAMRRATLVTGIPQIALVLFTR